MPFGLDGLTPVVPPESQEPTRDAPLPAADASFETHLQRQPESTAAETSDDGAEVDSDAVTDQEGLPDAGQEPAQTVPEDAAQDQESSAPEVDRADEPLVISDNQPVDIPSLETPKPTEPIEPTLENETTRVATTVEEVEQNGFVEAELGVTLPAQADTDEHQQGKPANLVDAQTPLENAAASEPQVTTEPAPHTGAVKPVLEALPVDVPAKAVGETRPDDKHVAAHRGPESPLRVDSAETVGAAKQPSVAIEQLAGTLPTKGDAQVEAVAEVESISPLPAGPEGKSDAGATSPHDRFTQQLMTGGGERTSRNNVTGNINQNRFVDRVARAFRVVEGQGGTIKMRLHPPELGLLQVQLKVQGNGLIAKLEAETPAARALLVDSLPVLRERLAEQGVRIEQFDVDLMERHPHQQPDGTGQRSADERNADGTSPVESTDDESPSSQPSQLAGGENQQLNIIV